MRAWITAITLALCACSAQPSTDDFWEARNGQSVTFLDRNGHAILREDRVTIDAGVIEGMGPQPSGVRLFRGIPYAAPPTGENRWRAPQPVAAWEGVREAKEFGPRCIPTQDFADMVFRSAGQSEDCLTLNVWTPARGADERLPVLVYFYGGGYITGAGDEPRYDGEALAARGIVVVTMNYRLGVFGFMAHPELTAEAPYHASGNYAFLDHLAALQWVRDNIAAFGGDPSRVTVAGESAGSASSSAVMISPLTKDLIAGAIGESGSLEDLDLTLAQGEQTGLEIARQLGADTLAALRALPAERISAFQQAHGDPTGPTVDGYFFPRPPREILAAGEQARVPLLVGSNSEESAADAVLESAAPTLANYHAALSRLYGANANAVFAAYPASGDGDPVTLAARELANDRFIGANTWNWIDAATRTGGRNTYYYYFDQPRPPVRDGVVSPYGADWRSPRGAMHSAEIEYALGNLPGNTIYAWTDTDRAVSELMQGYFVNFVKKGDPNGEGLPAWGTYASRQRMIVAGTSRSEADASRARYQIMSQLPR